MLQKTVGNNVRQLRHNLGISQYELYLRCGIATSAISGIERGQHNPTMSTLSALAFEFNLTPYDLFREIDGVCRTANAYIKNHLASCIDAFKTSDPRMFSGLFGSDALKRLTVCDIEVGAR